MSFKDPCKQSFKDIKNMPRVVKDILEDFVDDLDGLHERSGSVEGFRARAKEFANNKILDISKVRNEVIGDIAKATRNRDVLEMGIKQRVDAGQDPVKAAAEAFRALLSDTTDVTTNGKLSAESRMQSYQGALLAELKKLDRIEGGRDALASKEMEPLIYKEMYELNEGREGGVSGNAKALELAKVVKSLNKVELAIKQNAGVSVGENKGFITTRRYSAEMILENFKDADDFATRLGASLNTAESFLTSKDLDSSLRGMYNDIVKGKDTRYMEHFPEEIAESIDPRLNMSRRLSNKYNKARKLVFKDAASEYEMMKLMSDENLYESLVSRVTGTSRAMAAVATFGTNPELGYKNLRKYITEKNPAIEKELSGTFTRVDDMFEAMKGQRPADSIVNTFSNGYVAVKVGTTLGGAILSAGGDFPMAIGAVKSRTGRGLVGSTQDMINDFFSAATSKEARQEFGEALQIVTEYELGHMHSRHAGMGGADPVKLGGFANFTLSVSGFHRQIFAARHSVAAGIARAVAIGVKEGKMSDALTTHLGGYGFNASRIKLLSAGMETINVVGGPRDMVTPRALEKNLKGLGDLSGFKEAEGFKGSDEKFIGDIVNSYRSFLNDVAQIGSPNTTIRDKTLMKLGMDSSHPMAAILRMMTLFKSFGVSFPRKMAHVIKGVPGNINKPFMDAAMTKQGLTYSGGLLGGLTTMAVINQVVRDAVNNKTLDLEAIDNDPSLAAKYIGKAALNTGVAGIYGMYLSSMLEKGIAEGITETTIGPPLKEIKDIGSALRKSRRSFMDAMAGDEEWSEAAKKTFSETLVLGAKQIPNVWWGGAALRAATIDAVQNQLDPEAGDRRRQNLERYDEEAGKKSIFNEGE
jgi:hypothetical protein